MIWEYVLISLAIGILIGAVAMRLCNSQLRQQQLLQYQLKKNKAELEKYREELSNHFVHIAELLDNITIDHRQLYQYMAKSSSNLLPEMTSASNPFYSRLAQFERNNNPVLVQIPRDYPDDTSS